MNKMKLSYIVPTTRWVWIGLDKMIAQDEAIGGGMGISSNPGSLPDIQFVKGEDSLDDGMWNENDNSWPSSSGVWDNAW